MSEIVIFDTSVLMDHLRSGRYRRVFADVRGAVRMSSVVLAELWGGASTLEDIRCLEALGKMLPVLTPTEADWQESGRLLTMIGSDKRLEPEQVRDLHFDLLIALTARAHGAKLITSNRVNFELIRGYRDFGLEVW
ncbi:MAG: type II toxin-antitoxin system VapC family toxin [Terracidiphilus sp.]|jgi:predicted nucleic acid-binding protein